MMLKLIPTILLCMFAVGMGAKLPDSKVAIEVMRPVIKEAEVGGHYFKPFLTVSKCDNCTISERERMKTAIAKVNEVVVGSCFREKLTSMPLIQTNGRTPAQVVDSLVGVEVQTEMYWTPKRVLGYTLPNVPKIWVNRRYMMKWGVCDLGSLLSHEASHKLGYGHDFKATKRRPQSVPYSINRAFDYCCN